MSTQLDNLSATSPALADYATKSLVLPQSRQIVLCLSGGGFRATFFHLGVILALRAMGRLKDVRDVYSVSGGSITAAHLAVNWDTYCQSLDKAYGAAKNLITSAKRDVRGRVIRRWLACLPLAFFIDSDSKFPRMGRIDFLEREYRNMFGNATMDSITREEGPDFHFLATSMMTAELCSFSTPTFVRGDIEFSGDTLSIAKAVSASSAFPPLFPPARLHRNEVQASAQEFGGYDVDFLADGGIYDNIGYSPLRDISEEGVQIIVSDAGGGFDLPKQKWFSFIFFRAVRATDILMKRVTDQILEVTRKSKEIIYIQIGTVSVDGEVKKFMGGDYPMQGTIEKGLANIRTDLDLFQDSEVNSLIIHGARTCYAAMAEHLDRPFPLDLSFLTANRLNNTQELTASSQRKFRFFARDWGSVLLIAYLIAIITTITALVLINITKFIYLSNNNNYLMITNDRLNLTNNRLNQSIEETIAAYRSALSQSECAKTIDHAPVYLTDENKNIVGTIENIRFTIIGCQSQNENSRFILTYSFFNRYGTHGGSQTMSIVLKDAQGRQVAESLTFPVNRNVCVYLPESNTEAGSLNGNLIEKVDSISMSTSTVSGPQSPC